MKKTFFPELLILCLFSTVTSSLAAPNSGNLPDRQRLSMPALAASGLPSSGGVDMCAIEVTLTCKSFQK
jgi:hypothetical protein